jgi:dTDP-4-amino-4,6-dideoxygalactose transaminase
MDDRFREFIPHSRPLLGQEEIERISAVISSGQIARAVETEAFENEFARWLSAAGAVSVNSGTAALHLTLRAMAIGPGDEVIIPSYVCTALLNAAHYVGADPVITDVLPETGNIDPDDVKKRLTPRTQAVIVPHLFGLPADMDALLALGPPVIEDCAQAVGARYRDQLVGTMGHAAIFSFYATKVMTTGEGGMVVSNDERLLSKAADLSDYDNRREYAVRYNYKMTDIQAAMGRVQLNRLAKMNRLRAKIAECYDAGISELPVHAPVRAPGRIYYRYVAGVRNGLDAWIAGLAGQGVGVARPVFKPLHRYLGQSACPGADAAWRRFLSLPIYPALSAADARRVVEAIQTVSGENASNPTG